MTERSGRYRVIAVHGFLGSAGDWETLHAHCPDARWAPMDLWRVFADRKVADWPAIGNTLGDELRILAADDDLPTFLVGYSLGARLALSIEGLGLASSPVAGTCLVSCHPGLAQEDDGARAARRAADEAWAARFIESPVGTIWKEWDAQPVFAGSAVPGRDAALPAPRVTIARAMRLASLASQPDRRPALRGWRKPLLWVTGARDHKFRAIAASLASENVPARFLTIDHAGHRVPWDNPVAFGRALAQWIDDVLSGRPQERGER